MSHEQDVLSAASAIAPVRNEVEADALAHHLQLTKPPGSLGEIEAVGVRLASIADSAIPPLAEPAAVAVFAGDHGVHSEGVSPWPQEVTFQMVMNFCAGGAAINVIGRANDLDVRVVNAGVAHDVPDHESLTNSPVRRGTRNLRVEAAMTRDEAAAAVMLGINEARQLIDGGARCVATGDMGICNTTPSAALICAVTGRTPAEVTGRGTGIDDETLALKTQVIADALSRVSAGAPAADGLDLVAELGGLEIAALAGFCLGAAERRVPVIIDGVISLAAALVAQQLQPAVVGYLLAGHLSVEPGAAAALEHLGLEPLLDLNLRLGEGSGAALAYPLVRSAARIMNEMATFESAGVGGSEG